MGVIKAANLALRFILELCALGALAYWGFHNGQGLALKILEALREKVASA